MLDRALNLLDTALFRLRIGLEILRRLPLVKCPACGGAGGAMGGYEEPEWDDCWHCDPYVRWFEEYGIERFIGRINPLRWPWVKFRAATGQWTVTGWVLCKFGCHVTEDEGFCLRCYDYEEVRDA